MLYYLSEFSKQLNILNIFRYISFRSVNAAFMSFMIVVILGPRFIKWLKKKKIGEKVEKADSETLDQLHKDKANTPTMGGLIIFIAILVSTLLWCKLGEPKVLGAIATIVLLGAIGVIDDYIKLTKKSRGMSGKTKLVLQIILGLGIGILLLNYGNGKFFEKIPGSDSFSIIPTIDRSDVISIPFMKNPIVIGTILYVIWCAIVLSGTSNAVNLTDGLDGLAIGCSIFTALTFGILTYIAGHLYWSKYLYVLYVEGAGELTIFMSALVGAGMGFLWFNCFPAQVFMGDTGSLPLGGAIGYTALASRQEILLIIAGGIFLMEAMSVILQVLSFRLTGKRIFRIAPLHHHYQFGGLHEVKITVRFWIISTILMLLALGTLKMR